MSNPRLDLLGTKTAYVPTLEDASKSFFSKYNPENDTFVAEQNNLAVGFRPSWVLQARELTELQTILKNQLRLIIEGDEVVLSKPEDIADGGGLRKGWFNKDKLTVSYETTDDPTTLPIEAVDKYNEIYGTVQYKGQSDSTPNSAQLPEGTHVGHWLKDGNMPEDNNHDKIHFVNFRDFKRITFGPGEIYSHPQDGLQSYFLTNDETRHIDLCGWVGSDEWYAAKDRIYDEDGQEGAPDSAYTNYPPNEYNANGSGATANIPLEWSVDNHESPRELLGVQPDVTYIFGLSFHESVVKPGGTASNDRYLLDNAAGYNNHEAPGAYRVKFVVDSMDYIPVFTGSLCPYAVQFCKTLVNFPWDDEVCPVGVPDFDGNGVDHVGFGWSDFWSFLVPYVDNQTTSFPSDHDLYPDRPWKEVAAEKLIQALGVLGYEIKPGDETLPDFDKRIVLYKYPTVEEYFNIFNKYGIRKTFVDTENQLDDREKNRLKLNHNSVVWDYRLIDPEYLSGPDYVPQGGIIGNGLMDLYMKSAYHNNLLGFAFGINYAQYYVPFGGDLGDFVFYQNHELDPMFIPYVPTLKIGYRGAPQATDPEPYFIERLTQTVAQIKSLASDALTTSTNQNFIPILHVTNNIFGEIGGSDGVGLGFGKIFDPRELRFIMSPSPRWDWYVADTDGDGVENDGAIAPRTYYSYHGVTLPLGNTESISSTYFTKDGPYTWTQ